MSQDRKGDTSTLSILFLAGAIGIGIWFLTVVSDFADSGTSPVYAVFFFVPICGVFMVVVPLAGVVIDVVIWSLTGPTKNETELSEEEPSSKVDGEKEGKKQGNIKQILILYIISIFLLLIITLLGLYFLNN
jgi:hypothetical protein